MDTVQYKYSPSDFEAYLGLSVELKNFYKLYEQYKATGTRADYYYLRSQWEVLFLSIKHREMEGLHYDVAHEMREYFEELMNDN